MWRLGPRPGLPWLFRLARAFALVQDRDYVLPDDVQNHGLRSDGPPDHSLPVGRMRGLRTADVIEQLLESVAVPGAAR